MGLFHADTANRQSLAADVMEPIRPHVDPYVLNLARIRTFATKDFAELRDGSCRLSSALTHGLAATMPRWAKLVAPYAEGVARHVARLAKGGLGTVHPIAAAQRARVKLRLKPIAAPEPPRARPTVPMSALHNACRDCGAVLKVRKRIYCDDCLPSHRKEQLAARPQASSRLGRRRSPRCAPPATILPTQKRSLSAGRRPPRSNVGLPPRGATTVRSMASTSTATSFQTYRASR